MALGVAGVQLGCDRGKPGPPSRLWYFLVPRGDKSPKLSEPRLYKKKICCITRPQHVFIELLGSAGEI